MYEYKVLSLRVEKCEETLNQYAKEGWRLVTTIPSLTGGNMIAVTLEKEAE